MSVTAKGAVKNTICKKPIKASETNKNKCDRSKKDFYRICCFQIVFFNVFCKLLINILIEIRKTRLPLLREPEITQALYSLTYYTSAFYSPFFSYPLHYPINDPIERCGGDAVGEHGARDDEHLRPEPEDVTLCCCQVRTQQFYM